MTNNKTSYGQRLLKELLGHILVETPIENYRPAWLLGMEIDLFYPRSRLAFEFQGDQHFEAGIYGDKQELAAQRDRDARKKVLCKQGRERQEGFCSETHGTLTGTCLAHAKLSRTFASCAASRSSRRSKVVSKCAGW